jgi:uncharacterized membrane protein
MFSLKTKWTEHYLEELMSILLRAGVAISAAVVLAGGGYYLMKYGMQMPEYRVFQGEPHRFKCVSGICLSAYNLSARGIIDIGLLILIATPIARVAFGLYAFALQKDRVYVIVTSIVLAILLFNLLVPHL